MHYMKNIYNWIFTPPETLGLPFNIYESQFMLNGDIKIYQSEHMGAIKEFSRREIPYYFDNDFDIITKNIMINNKPLFVLPYKDKYGKSSLITSSGSTGEPFSYYVMDSDFNGLALRLWYILMHTEYGINCMNGKDRVLGLSLRGGNDRLYKLNNNFLLQKTTMDDADLWWVSLGVFNYSSAHACYDKAFNIMKNDKFKAIAGAPSLIEDFISYCDQNGLKLRNGLKILTAGENVSKEFKTKLAMMGMTNYDFFHSPDGAAVIYECKYGRYHIYHMRSFIEQVDNKFISTSYYNACMPFIRYYNGDLIDVPMWLDEKCKCGREGQVVNSIVGRETERLLVADNEYISSMQIYAIFSAFDRVKKWRIIQRHVGAIEIYIQNKKEAQPYLNPLKIEIQKIMPNNAIIFKDMEEYDQDIKKNVLIKRLC